MAKQGGKSDELRPIIVKKIKKGGGGHHGGAWKVAYADFVTAMMAFFLLLWLLNVTTEEQKMGIAEYFDPNPKISQTVSGANGMLGGLSVSKEGAMVDNRQVMPQPQENNPSLRPGQDKISEDAYQKEKKKREEENFKKAEKALNSAMDSSPELQELKKNLRMDMTPEGLRIQVVDQEGKPMFPSGSAEMYDRTKTLLEKVAEVIRKMPNEISVRGHTDGVPYSKGTGYGNWELSADRANASRRVLVAAGFPEKNVNNVVGKADKDHLVTDNANDAQNRRISIVLLREELVTQVGTNMSTDAVKEQQRAAKGPLYQKSSGSVEFP
jgi:chemotaxis protein MotB